MLCLQMDLRCIFTETLFCENTNKNVHYSLGNVWKEMSLTKARLVPCYLNIYLDHTQWLIFAKECSFLQQPGQKDSISTFN